MTKDENRVLSFYGKWYYWALADNGRLSLVKVEGIGPWTERLLK